jgi:mycoredoxin
MAFELFGTKSCPFTAELRDDLEWKGVEFVEYDVEADPLAMRRLAEMRAEATAPMVTAVPVLVEDGRIVQVGMNGRSCYITPA